MLNEEKFVFIIPIRHHSNAKDWSKTIQNLNNTVASIKNQISENWKLLIVANTDSEIPNYEGVEIVRVSFPPNKLHDLTDSKCKEEFYSAFRYDKGNRVLAALKRINNCSHFMVVDDDDFVSSKIVEFILNSSKQHWKIANGYTWNEGAKYIVEIDNFNKLCGTSYIIEWSSFTQLFDVYNMSESDICMYLGSHTKIEEKLKSQSHKVSTVPFNAAIYRLGHVNSHGQFAHDNSFMSIIRLAFRAPITALRVIKAHKYISKKVSKEFTLK